MRDTCPIGLIAIRVKDGLARTLLYRKVQVAKSNIEQSTLTAAIRAPVLVRQLSYG
jgi:hypothetical protein